MKMRHGVVNCGKSSALINDAKGYIYQGKKIQVWKPAIDNRNGTQFVKSRNGSSIKVDMLIHSVNDIKEFQINGEQCIFIDEAQFLKVEEVNEIRKLADKITIILYCLKSTFKTKLFEGSARILEVADSIEEPCITTCILCNKKAIYNLCHVNGEKILDGPDIALGSGEKYVPVCNHHFVSWEKTPQVMEKLNFFKTVKDDEEVKENEQ